MGFSVFAQVLLPILAIVAAGFLLQRRLELDLQSVNRLSLYLLSPALIFSSLVQSRIEVTETLRIGAFMTLFVISIGAITWFVAIVLRLEAIDRAAMMLSSMPTAVNVTILAIEFDVRPRFVSSVVAVSTVASVLSLTLILVLLGVE